MNNLHDIDENDIVEWKLLNDILNPAKLILLFTLYYIYVWIHVGVKQSIKLFNLIG